MIRRLLVVYVVLCALPVACSDDQGSGAMHEAVSTCFARYPFKKGSAYDRFMCITEAHLKYGPNAIGPRYDLVSQVDLASLRIGLDVDAGTLTVPQAQTELNWVTTKAQTIAFHKPSTPVPTPHERQEVTLPAKYQVNR
ncbi:hypothetical protein [Acetobacter garciniae]|uniref:hypothetical protein n=1 Tax=Acetobacter garciniae TaxID=2817435 RepID=UPI001E3E9B6A|nr:hypothetical protein [Acetobacter garciniae]